MVSADLEGYLILARSVQGQALTRLLYDMIHAPNIYHFQGLLNMPKVQALAGTQDMAWLRLLEIFTSGTIQDYKKESHMLPPIKEEAMEKLNLLTVLTIASQHQVIPSSDDAYTQSANYAVLSKELDLNGDADIEAIIIRAMQAGLFKGRLDARRKVLSISQCLGRDIPRQSWHNLGASADTGCQRIALSKEHLSNTLENIRIQTENTRRSLEAHSQALKTLSKNVRRSELIGDSEIDPDTPMDDPSPESFSIGHTSRKRKTVPQGM